jgi:hypothetical protein
MYHTLFALAGLAMLGWILLIILPGWGFTRRVAESALFPLYLCALYLVGIVAVILEMGPGFMADFGSAEGVLALLATGPVALVAWIHILAFDHLVGVLIYRDNLKHRFVPVPVQSVLLFATLMLGPVGFLTYWLIRVSRQRSLRLAWGEEEAPAAKSPTSPPPATSTIPSSAAPLEASEAAPEPGEAGGAPGPEHPQPPLVPHFREVVRGDSALRMLMGVWRRTPAMVVLGLVGFGLAGVTVAVAVANGSWLMPPEGRLLEAVKFDVAVGIYVLTLALILPFRPFTSRGRKRWVGWFVGLTLFGYGMETIQALRGLDPRFTTAGSVVDQVLGGVFFLTALGLMVLFIVLVAPFFRNRALPDHPTLRLGLRYGTAGAMVAFGVGILMSLIATRSLGEGDLMATHAAGFHSLQAVPLVALLLGAGAASGVAGRADGERLTPRPEIHLAGVGWVLLCVGLATQAFLGRPPTELSPALFLATAGAALWLASLGWALRVRFGPGRPSLQPPGPSPESRWSTS